MRPPSGQYEIVGSCGGGTGQERNVVRNEPLPVRAEVRADGRAWVPLPAGARRVRVRNAFDLTFDEIASVVWRDAGTCRAAALHQIN